MASGPPKRTRTGRAAALELPPGKWRRLAVSLRRHDVLMRIALCLSAALLLCVVIRGWHPPFSYRENYTPLHDLGARVEFKLPDANVTEEAEQKLVPYEIGQTLAEAGQPLHQGHIRVLRGEHEAWIAQSAWSQRFFRGAAVMAIILALIGLCGLYLYNRQRYLAVDMKRLALLLGLATATVILSRALSRWEATYAWWVEVIPLVLFGQTVAIVYRRELALLLSGVVTLVLVLGVGYGLGAFLLLLGVTATAILQLGRIRNRSKLIYVAGFAGLAASLLTVGMAVLDNQPFTWTLVQAAGMNALCAFSTGFLMLGLLFFIERLFGVLTDISLLELGDVSHPLLQELVHRSPGTYNHSIIVGAIAEAAADAIGAWGLLTRVGAYFHDIGKMLKPIYFIENQPPNDNRHEGLVPAMSTLVIVAHVKDGTDLARQHRLPSPIVEIIEQHHGTTLVEYFFGRATEQRQADPNGSDVQESSFRYPGPKPQSKEAGVLMLTDAAESACRSLVDPAPARIESTVREVALRRLEDGQFDESGLTLRELRMVEQSVVKSLIANYHGRIKYPDQRTA